MSLKRRLIESGVFGLSRLAGYTRASRKRSERPGAIFVLRNNDIGDLLVVTPLFAALRQCFPETRIIAGVGAWNLDVLKGNPHLDEVLIVNAPWHNKSCGRFAHNSPRGLLDSLAYILGSPEVRAIRDRSFEIGIDVLGSPEGSLLLLKAQIPFRLGVEGYAGGNSAAHRCVKFNPNERVGRSALQFAELLGATELPEPTPQIFLSEKEQVEGQRIWDSLAGSSMRPTRVVVGPGGGVAEKCWPLAHFVELATLMTTCSGCQVVIVGGRNDEAAGKKISEAGAAAKNLVGRLSLRETFSLVSQADLTISNSSMLMHVAAAFKKPAVVLLGDSYPSARQHSAQWGHGSLSSVLGRESDHEKIYSASEAFQWIEAHCLSPVERH